MGPSGRIFVARQPILDASGRLFGHELLYRGSQQATEAQFLDRQRASLQTLIGVFVDVGADALLGSHVGFLNVTGEVIRTDLVEALPRERVVLEVLEASLVDRRLLERLAELRQAGFRIALDDFAPNDEREVLLPEVDFVKVDLPALRRYELRTLVARLRHHPVRLVAEKVETRKQFEHCRRLGFDLFQGFYFARPVTLSAPTLDPARAVILDLLRRLREGADVPAVERAIKPHATLAVNLLRLVNSVGLARRQRIGSVRQALVLLGTRQLERWLMLLLFAGDDPRGASSPLLQLAAMRGRLMEILCERLDPPAPRGEGERAFLTGMVSLVDALLGIEKREVLERLRVEKEIAAAVTEHAGRLGQLLAAAEAVEQGRFDAIPKQLEALGLSAGDLLPAQLAAFEWVHGVERSGVGGEG